LLHSEHAWLAVLLVYFPKSQSVQDVLAEPVANSPALQSKHADELLTRANVPGLHSKHSLAPFLFEYFPFSQLTQDVLEALAAN
jgi:hypothetical protein